MSTFGLVHGAWHGPWCFDQIVPELNAAGHTVVAVDLPIDRVSSPSDWVAAVVKSLKGHDDIVLVGHSLAGIVVPIAAEALPVRQVIYLAGVLRRPGRSLAQDYEDGASADMTPASFTGEGLKREDGFTWWESVEAAIATMYQDCDQETAKSAAGRLRKQCASQWTDVSPQKQWPRLPAAYILGRNDRVLNPVWARRVVPQWLGIDPIELPGGHSPFLSRPKQLARILSQIAEAGSAPQ